MVERAVKVSLSASMLSYQKGMQDAADATRKVGTEGEKLAQLREVYDGIGRGALVMGGLMATGIGVAISRFADFDAAMSNVKAATHESAGNMGLLREAAIEAGASTVFSATEAAGAVEELAKAGVSTSDILSGALAGSLDLAAAGELGVARAAEITSTALNQFGLDGGKASHVADVLAAGAGKAMGSVEDLANGLKFVGPVAASMGVSLEETTGVLALFAQQGIIGEQAGTSLRGVLSSLTAPSSQASKEIERLGITLYDSNGKFLGMQNAAGELSKAYTGMDDASRQASLGIIFGRETITAATSLYKAGSDGVAEWTKAVDDSGFAAETARMRLDNLKGDLEGLGGALDSALIQTGSGANGVLRDMVQALTGLTNGYSELPDGIQGAVLAIGVGTTAVTLTGGAALIAVPKFLAFKASVDAAGFALGSMTAKAGAIGLVLGAIAFAVGELAKAQQEARTRAEAYADTLEEGTHKITGATRQMVEANLSASKQQWWWQQDSAFENARTLGVDLDTVREATLGNVDALREFNAATDLSNKNSYERAQIADRLGISMTDLDVATGQLRDTVRGENSSIEEAIKLGQEKEEQDKKGTPTTHAAADAYLKAASGAEDLANSLDQVIDKIMEANGMGQDAVSRNIAFEDSIDKLDDAIRKAREGQEGYALTLDVGTEAGRRNMGMLVDLANNSQAAAKAQFQLDGDTAKFRTTLEQGRQAVIDRATALGMNADEASRLADQIYRIPTDKEIKVIAQTAEAGRTIDRFISDNTGKQIPLRVTATGIEQIRLPNGMTGLSSENGNLVDYRNAMGRVQKFENGGFPTGIYGARPQGIHKFAEPNTRWEAYISGKESEEDRNIAIWQETGDRLGVRRGGVTVTQNYTIAPVIHAAPGTDETAIVNKAVRRIEELLR